MITTMDNLLADVNKVGKKEDFTILTFELEAKLALVQHSLTHAPEQLSDKEFVGLSLMIGEIHKGVARMGEYNQKAQEYFYFLNRPETLKDIQKIESSASNP